MLPAAALDTPIAAAEKTCIYKFAATYTLADAPAVVTLDVQTNANTSASANDPGWATAGLRVAFIGLSLARAPFI